MSKKKQESAQDFIPIKNLRAGIIETTDGRYIKILEIEPINFMLRSEDEQSNIISTFANWLKISPVHLQFKSITRKADSDRHIAMLKQDLQKEDNKKCKGLGEGYIELIKEVGMKEALTRRFFLIFEYESPQRTYDDFAQAYSVLKVVEQNARAYLGPPILPDTLGGFVATDEIELLLSVTPFLAAIPPNILPKNPILPPMPIFCPPCVTASRT